MVDREGFIILHGEHLRIKSRLTETLLEDAGLVDQFVRDNRIVHAHTTLVEDTHNFLVVAEFFREVGAELFLCGGDSCLIVGLHMRDGMGDRVGGEPGAESLEKGLIAEVVAPEGAVLHARLGK